MFGRRSDTTSSQNKYILAATSDDADVDLNLEHPDGVIEEDDGSNNEFHNDIHHASSSSSAYENSASFHNHNSNGRTRFNGPIPYAASPSPTGEEETNRILVDNGSLGHHVNEDGKEQNNNNGPPVIPEEMGMFTRVLSVAPTSWRDNQWWKTETKKQQRRAIIFLSLLVVIVIVVLYASFWDTRENHEAPADLGNDSVEPTYGDKWANVMNIYVADQRAVVQVAVRQMKTVDPDFAFAPSLHLLPSGAIANDQFYHNLKMILQSQKIIISPDDGDDLASLVAEFNGTRPASAPVSIPENTFAETLFKVAVFTILIEQTKLNHNRYPTSLQDLASLLDAEANFHQNLTKLTVARAWLHVTVDPAIYRDFNDSWGRPLKYSTDQSSYQLFSYGGDGALGGVEDAFADIFSNNTTVQSMASVLWSTMFASEKLDLVTLRSLEQLGFGTLSASMAQSVSTSTVDATHESSNTPQSAPQRRLLSVGGAAAFSKLQEEVAEHAAVIQTVGLWKHSAKHSLNQLAKPSSAHGEFASSFLELFTTPSISRGSSKFQAFASEDDPNASAADGGSAAAEGGSAATDAESATGATASTGASGSSETSSESSERSHDEHTEGTRPPASPISGESNLEVRYGEIDNTEAAHMEREFEARMAGGRGQLVDDVDGLGLGDGSSSSPWRGSTRGQESQPLLLHSDLKDGVQSGSGFVVPETLASVFQFWTNVTLVALSNDNVTAVCNNDCALARWVRLRAYCKLAFILLFNKARNSDLVYPMYSYDGARNNAVINDVKLLLDISKGMKTNPAAFSRFDSRLNLTASDSIAAFFPSTRIIDIERLLTEEFGYEVVPQTDLEEDERIVSPVATPTQQQMQWLTKWEVDFEEEDILPEHNIALANLVEARYTQQEEDRARAFED